MATNRTTFLEPLWRRVLLVGVCFAWSGWEFWSGATSWGTAFGAMGVYAAWTYLYDYGRQTPPPSAPDDGSHP